MPISEVGVDPTTNRSNSGLAGKTDRPSKGQRLQETAHLGFLLQPVYKFSVSLLHHYRPRIRQSRCSYRRAHSQKDVIRVRLSAGSTQSSSRMISCKLVAIA